MKIEEKIKVLKTKHKENNKCNKYNIQLILRMKKDIIVVACIVFFHLKQQYDYFNTKKDNAYKKTNIIVIVIAPQNFNNYLNIHMNTFKFNQLQQLLGPTHELKLQVQSTTIDF